MLFFLFIKDSTIQRHDQLLLRPSSILSEEKKATNYGSYIHHYRSGGHNHADLWHDTTVPSEYLCSINL